VLHYLIKSICKNEILYSDCSFLRLAVEIKMFYAKSRCNNCQNVDDLSPIYIFLEQKEDTLAEVNRKNSIISTNWIQM
jgi:hypothetical protein